MARFLNRNFILSTLAIVASTTLGAFFLPYSVPALRGVEYAAEDARSSLFRAPEAPDPNVVLVTVTEETLSGYPYRDPVDRGLLADLLRNLADASPRAIGLYLAFTGPTEPDKDARLKDTLQSLPVPLVVARPPDGSILTETQRRFSDDFTAGLRSGLRIVGEDPADSVVRWNQPSGRAAGERQPSFAAALAKTIGAAPPPHAVRLAYHGVPNENTDPFLTIPAHDAVTLPGKWFTGKVVLIGLDTLTATRHRVPGLGISVADADTLPGVRIQAHAVAQLLDGRRVAGANELTALAVSFVMCLIGAALALPRLSHAIRAGALAGGIAVFGLTALTLFYGWGAPIPVAMPVLGYLGAYFLTAGAVRRFGRGRRDYLREGFRERTSPRNVQRIMTDALDIDLGGEDREITVMITNLTNFTRIAEGLSPGDIVDVMNGYLEGICGTVAKYDGVVDRVDIDSVISIFGAPLDQEDHASRAVRCALDVDGFAESYRERRMTSAGRLDATRIGLHTGHATVGNFGGSAVFAYSAQGESVHTADRMQAANKPLGTHICASADTARAATDIIFRPVGRLRWRNENQVVDAFEPLPETKSETPEIEAYVRAYRLIQCEDATAHDELARAIQIAPQDPLLKLYQFRLSQGRTGTTIMLDG